jgi:hypothetical protein
MTTVMMMVMMMVVMTMMMFDDDDDDDDFVPLPLLMHDDRVNHFILFVFFFSASTHFRSRWSSSG